MIQQNALLVDNDLKFLDILGGILITEGYRVRTARDGKEALAEIHRNPPDVLFTDLIIPKISGEQLIRYVRDNPAIAPMVIVVVSGAILEYSEHEQIAADYFITKSNIHSFRQHVIVLSQKIRSRNVSDRSSFGRTLITDQSLRSRKIVEELLNNRQHILQVLENLQAGLLVYDIDLRILSANPAAEILLEKPISLILGRLVEDQFEKDYHASLQKRLQPGDENQEESGQLTVHTQDKILDLNISHLKNSLDGAWQGGLVLMVDVTRLEKLHGYLESAARVAALLLKRENAHDQVFSVLEIMGRAAGASRSYWYQNSRDSSGNVWMGMKAEWRAEGICSQSTLTDQRRISYSAEFSRWYSELSADRIIAGAVKDFPESESRFLQSLGIRSILIIPLLMKGRFEGFIGFDNCFREVPWKDPEIHLMRMATDSLAKAFDYEMSLTEKNKLQDQLLHSQRMKFMGEISAGLSHNFRNILAGILGNAEFINLKYQDVAEIQKCTSSIINIARNGTDLISGLMKFSRMEPRGPKRIFNLAATLQECCQIISTSFDKHINIQNKWPQVIAVEGDPSELSQVFMNLFANARDAMPEGGTLRIEAGEGDQQIIIRVSDTGCGMAEETARRVFDPFFTTKVAGQGTGLGLSTAYGIVHNYGGDIQVFSQPGMGTVFTVTLPGPMLDAPQTHLCDDMLIPGQGEKILIVDDDETIFGILKKLLESNGYIVSIATSGQEAVSLYPVCRPDVVLMDRNMPVMDGVAAATKILEMDPSARIIIASGYEEEGPDGVPPHLRNVIQGYIVKPFEIARLSKLLAEVLKL